MKYLPILLISLFLFSSCGETESTTQQVKKGSGNVDQQKTAKSGTGNRIKNTTPSNTGEEFFIETKNVADFNSVTTMEKSEKL